MQASLSRMISIGIYDVNQEGSEYWRIYVIGLLNTLWLAAVGIVLATALGLRLAC